MDTLTRQFLSMTSIKKKHQRMIKQPVNEKGKLATFWRVLGEGDCEWHEWWRVGWSAPKKCREGRLFQAEEELLQRSKEKDGLGKFIGKTKGQWGWSTVDDVQSGTKWSWRKRKRVDDIGSCEPGLKRVYFILIALGTSSLSRRVECYHSCFKNKQLVENRF